MWVSRREFNELLEAHNESVENQNVWNAEADDKVDTLTRQMKCKCENYEVLSEGVYSSSGEFVDGRLWWVGGDWRIVYSKKCLDCGWTTTYDTEEEALADKQELLDKQIDALKEQKKALKKK
jgi:hypothetical protein